MAGVAARARAAERRNQVERRDASTCARSCGTARRCACAGSSPRKLRQRARKGVSPLSQRTILSPAGSCSSAALRARSGSGPHGTYRSPLGPRPEGRPRRGRGRRGRTAVRQRTLVLGAAARSEPESRARVPDDLTFRRTSVAPGDRPFVQCPPNPMPRALRPASAKLVAGRVRIRGAGTSRSARPVQQQSVAVFSWHRCRRSAEDTRKPKLRSAAWRS